MPGQMHAKLLSPYTLLLTFTLLTMFTSQPTHLWTTFLSGSAPMLAL
jgi:hypothetical protein